MKKIYINPDEAWSFFNRKISESGYGITYVLAESSDGKEETKVCMSDDECCPIIKIYTNGAMIHDCNVFSDDELESELDFIYSVMLDPDVPDAQEPVEETDYSEDYLITSNIVDIISLVYGEEYDDILDILSNNQKECELIKDEILQVLDKHSELF